MNLPIYREPSQISLAYWFGLSAKCQHLPTRDPQDKDVSKLGEFG